MGYGNLGEVRKAKHIESGQNRAIKIFSKLLLQKNQIDRVKYEINLMKTFDHPNICRIYEWLEDNARVYVVMEYLTGGDLHDRIVARKRTYFTEEEIASVI